MADLRPRKKAKGIEAEALIVQTLKQQLYDKLCTTMRGGPVVSYDDDGLGAILVDCMASAQLVPFSGLLPTNAKRRLKSRLVHFG